MTIGELYVKGLSNNTGGKFLDIALRTILSNKGEEEKKTLFSIAPILKKMVLNDSSLVSDALSVIYPAVGRISFLTELATFGLVGCEEYGIFLCVAFIEFASFLKGQQEGFQELRPPYFSFFQVKNKRKNPSENDLNEEITSLAFNLRDTIELEKGEDVVLTLIREISSFLRQVYYDNTIAKLNILGPVNRIISNADIQRIAVLPWNRENTDIANQMSRLSLTARKREICRWINRSGVGFLMVLQRAANSAVVARFKNQ